jgi:hypothetical protein
MEYYCILCINDSLYCRTIWTETRKKQLLGCGIWLRSICLCERWKNRCVFLFFLRASVCFVSTFSFLKNSFCIQFLFYSLFILFSRENINVYLVPMSVVCVRLLFVCVRVFDEEKKEEIRRPNRDKKSKWEIERQREREMSAPTS